MRITLKIFAILAVTTMVAVAMTPAGCAYSSSIEAEGGISATYSMINIYDKVDGEIPTYVAHSGSITDLALECKSNVEHGTTYYKYEGYVSNTLYLQMIGSGPARVQTTLTGVSNDLYVQVLFNNGDAVVLDSHNNWTGVSQEYQMEEYISFTVFASAQKTTNNSPTLGDLKFAMVKTDSETGSTVLVGGNDITLRMVRPITKDEDVQNVLGDSNEHQGSSPAVSGNVSTSQSPVDFYFVQSGSSSTNHSVFITTNKRDSQHVVPMDTEFNFDLKIPAGYEFCIKIQVSRVFTAVNTITLTPVDSIVSGSATVSTDNRWGSNTVEYISVMTEVKEEIVSYQLKKSPEGLVYGSCPNDLVLHFEGSSEAWLAQGLISIEVIMR